MKSGSAEHSMDVLLSMFQDIETTCRNAETTKPVCNQLLANIKNTMTDRCSVEKSYNQMLQKYRAELLPQVVEGWDNLDEHDKSAMSTMNNFFCGLHYIVGLADQA
eukprot:scpid99812/ scgid15579/ 